jgi:hypothetical protein
MDKDADNPLQAAADSGFLGYKKGRFRGPAFTAQGGGGVEDVQVFGNGKNNRDQIFFRKPVPAQQFVIKGRNLFPYVLLVVEAPGRPPKGKKPFCFHY